MREDALLPKPASSSFEQAAATPLAAVTALQALRTVGKVEQGTAVLINGAAGGVGTFAVQIAKALGADVTAVASSRNLDQARALGADRVIDYTRGGFAVHGERYDVIVAVNGYHPLSVYGRALKPGGTYVMVGGTPRQWVEAVLLGPLRSRGDKKFARVNAAPALSGPAGERKMRTNLKDLAYVAELLESGDVVPVIDRRYSLNQVPEAIRYMEEGHARGKVVITIYPAAPRRRAWGKASSTSSRPPARAGSRRCRELEQVRAAGERSAVVFVEAARRAPPNPCSRPRRRAGLYPC